MEDRHLSWRIKHLSWENEFMAYEFIFLVLWVMDQFADPFIGSMGLP